MTVTVSSVAFPYHDGWLAGLTVSDSRTELSLALRAISGEKHVVILRNVLAFDVRFKSDDNTVLNLWLIAAERLADDPGRRSLVHERLGRDTVPDGTKLFLLETLSDAVTIVALCATAELRPGSLAFVEGDR